MRMRVRSGCALTSNDKTAARSGFAEPHRRGDARRGIDRAFRTRHRARGAIAIYDLVQQNLFAPEGVTGGSFTLHIGITGNRLMFDIRREDGAPVVAHLLSLTPFRRIVKDYFMICDSYYQAIRTAMPDKIEAIDMGRRGIHDEGSRTLQERLKGKVRVDFETARRAVHADLRAALER
jgi:uncharacterized protein (UPF0262 family)